MILNEVTRNQHIQKTKVSDNYVPSNQAKGKNRYYRRTYSKFSKSTSEYNKIDMTKFFIDNTLDLNIKVHGETDEYVVRIIISNICTYIRDELSKADYQLSMRIILRALIKAFNIEDIKTRCSCDDFKYRQAYWLTQHNAIAGDPQNDNGKKIRNPYDTKGSGCKHIQIVLSNNLWLRKVASVVYNYINYMEKHANNLYTDIIYPAIYGDAEFDNQTDNISNLTDLDTKDIDIANKYAREKNWFTKLDNKEKSSIDEVDTAQPVNAQQQIEKENLESNKQFDYLSLLNL